MVSLKGTLQTLCGRNWDLPVTLASIVLVIYVGFLLLSNYHYQAELQKAAIEQLRQNLDRRATGVSYFFSERRRNVRDLAHHRALGIYFENKALGMSLQYGLEASLLGISEAFKTILERERLGQDPIYTRILFVERGGEVLIESRLQAPESSVAREWKRFLTPERMEASVIVECENGLPWVIISMPYFFKGEFKGQILAWVSPQTVYWNLVGVTGGAFPGHFVYMASGEGSCVLPASLRWEVETMGLPTRVDHLDAAAVHRTEVVDMRGKRMDVLVNHTPIRDTPFNLLCVLPAGEVFGRVALWQLPLAMAALSLLLLGGTAMMWRTRTRNLVLKTRLEEEAKSTRALEEKNEQLEREMDGRMRIEAALRESEERYRRFFEEDFSGTFIAAPDGRLLACNSAFARIFGFASVDEALSMGGEPVFSDLWHRESLLALLRKRKRVKRYEREYRRKDGGGIQTIANLIGTFDDQGELVEIKGFLIDNTEQKKLEKQLHQAQKMEAIGTLAGGIAHDFNNILAAIVGYTEMALYHIPARNPARGNLEQVLKASERAKYLIRQILTFSRHTKQERNALRIGSIVKEALKLLQATLPATIEVRQSITASNALVLADATQIHQVLMNLCANAAYAMREQGGVLEVALQEVTIGAEEAVDLGCSPGAFVEIAVRDTGCGMDEETTSRIFDPFYTTKPHGDGTGLGLSVVHGIVKGHGGGVTVESEEGRGSTFRVFLPGMQGEAKDAEEVFIPLPCSRDQESILVVDDEEALLNVSRQMLEFLGYQVTTARNALDALELFRSDPQQFRLILTDQTMPKMTGVELAREVARVRPEVPVILCTGFSEFLEEERPKDDGIREVIMKPFVLSELAEAIRRVLSDG